MNKTQELASQKRYYAKRLFGEALERGGGINDNLPMARFVDAVIDAAVLEIAAIQQQSMQERSLHHSSSKNP